MEKIKGAITRGTMKTARKTLLPALVISAGILGATAANAATGPVAIPGHPAIIPATVTVLPGSLTETYVGDQLKVVDATGSGLGWHITATVVGGSATADATAIQTAATCSPPRSSMTWPVGIGNGQTAIVAQALPGSGMGTITYTMPITTTGRAAVTLSVITGP